MTEPLIQQARALGDKVAALSLAVEQLDRRTNRSERITLLVVFGLVLDMILSIAVALVLVNLVSTNDRLQNTIDREAETRQQALCPVYGLFLGSYNPNSRAPGAAREAYIRSFQVMRDAYASLDCQNALVPPRADQTTAPLPSPSPTTTTTPIQ